MTALHLILADQLSPSLSALRGADKKHDIILFCEVMEEATYVPHHPKKIAFLFSSMRHFAQALEKAGYTVRYVALDDTANTGSFDGEVARALKQTKAKRLIVTEPGEWRVAEKFRRFESELGVPVEVLMDDRFLCTIAQFRQWASGKRELRMEFFYREMRRQYGILLDGKGKPEGGQWNYDKDNRNPPKKGLKSPPRISHHKDAITQQVLTLVAALFGKNFGDLEPFHFAVTRQQALKEAQHFMAELLPQFGHWQDTMVTGEAYLYHSLLSAYLNAGLLLPLEICRMAEQEYREGRAPLNAVEGFIRQILGWREFIRGMYWLHMPGYATKNHLDAKRPLPGFYWGYETGMHCVREAVTHTREHAYSHHIQRLMVTGNFALLAGIDPDEVDAWYLAVYADAYEWVEMPNTRGMALYADGGMVGSKPYAASGKYIDRMSNYCKGCRYDPNESIGETACPFNALYWDFFARNEAKLKGLPRLPYVYANWEKMGAEKQKALRAQAKVIFQKMGDGTL